MAPYLQSLLPLAAIFASQVASFEFTYPTPGKSHTFADGDRAIVQWTSAVELPEVFLNCSTTPSGATPVLASAVAFTNALPGKLYRAHWSSQDGNNTFCKFCAGDGGKTCSGTFHLIDRQKGSLSTLWYEKGNRQAAQSDCTADSPTTITKYVTASSTDACGCHGGNSSNQTVTWTAPHSSIAQGTGTGSGSLPTITANFVGWNSTTPSLPLPSDTTITTISVVTPPPVPSPSPPKASTTGASPAAWSSHVNLALLGMLLVGSVFFAVL
ncbi:uncharacterized protein BP5553_03025 [Venustampulla echinocandica]|uniref:Uncharacterized protein n=1 Tax=Venustampulla echinocandica TaxID=2656787 RepID=A0A370TT29_9HELO|nr:uncharacterized protein BP5553_03025 [Venustampulla echinocandica]RDL38685.1 hypothetical protein BP5553_03025 [Venustampulla echinocandica]